MKPAAEQERATTEGTGARRSWPAARVRLAIAVVFFMAWLGWLGYLVLTTGGKHQVILSRPQFLISELDLIAQVDQINQGATPVTVQEVHWPVEARAKCPPGTRLTVTNLNDCRD